VASSDELDYLLAAVNQVFPQVQLNRSDMDFHYAGVRPLPRVDATTPAGVTRRHWLAETPDSPIPIYSVIGGKLTTCRSLAEQVTDTLLSRLNVGRVAHTQDRTILGGENRHSKASDAESHFQNLAEGIGWSIDQIRAVWPLLGTRAAVLAHLPAGQQDNLDGTSLPRELARWMIRNEHARTLGDLIERRLMLLYHPRLTRRCLEQLADILKQEGLIENVDTHVNQTIDRLTHHYGKKVHSG
jgi:glycerol-3-phosphate dehydrogenase